MVPAPILFVVDDDEAALRRTETALTRRFGADYEVRAAANPEEGLALLRQLNDVALIAA